MDLGLKGKAAIVTGASQGIGLAIAKALAAEGAKVSICARDEGRLMQAKAELDAIGGTVHAAPCNVGDEKALATYLQQANGFLGGLDVLVNNASAFGRDDDGEGWQRSFDVDLMGSVRACWTAVPIMAAAGGGAIVHISSIAGLQASTRTPPYGAIKAALVQLTKTQALQLAEKKIRVNAVAPGSIYFDAGVWGAAKRDNPALYEGILKSIPTGRYGTPEEVADLVVYLCSERASWVTGQAIAVDGGQML